jgi:hypothetical protein
MRQPLSARSSPHHRETFMINFTVCKEPGVNHKTTPLSSFFLQFEVHPVLHQKISDHTLCFERVPFNLLSAGVRKSRTWPSPSACSSRPAFAFFSRAVSSRSSALAAPASAESFCSLLPSSWTASNADCSTNFSSPEQVVSGFPARSWIRWRQCSALASGAQAPWAVSS